MLSFNMKDGVQMKKKFRKLSLVSLIIAIVLFVISYVMFHYLGPAGFSSLWRPEPGKPFVTFLFAVWGVCFLFGSVASVLVAEIIYGDED
jgi:tryptophan-rich sensory protein